MTPQRLAGHPGAIDRCNARMMDVGGSQENGEATKVMTSIYLTPSRKRALARRAKQRKATVSEEIRTAPDRHLERDHDEELQRGLAGC